ncbi:Rhodanese-like domain-containing protein [Scenedesmus sp. NREL 46B-D3]|nr:Rhodanese-like domain-containing protein [Scenedesmus sp. NREL 46B-D3]
MADVKQVPPTEAAELLEAGYTYLDVHTPEEFAAGHVKGAVNIPFMLSKPKGMAPNGEFVQQVKQQFPNQEQQLVVGCKAGPRSTRACAELAQEDYTGLVLNAAGWDGWVAADLPAAT